ncbi:MAG: 2-succinylbenzoate--CoA ligase [Opitutales bacterium]
MEASVDAFRERMKQPWLVHEPMQAAFEASFDEALKTFSDLPQNGRVLLAECDLPRFLGGALAALALRRAVFFGNEAWPKTAWAQVAEVLRPDVVWGKVPGGAFDKARNAWDGNLAGRWMIPTGGSGGRVRFAYHSWDSLRVSVQATAAFLEMRVLNACCVLPLYHVSGFMQCLRTWITGGVLALPSWKAWESGVLPNMNPDGFCLSLVPTQLERLMQNRTNDAFLAEFQAIFLGGAPASEDLLERAREAGLPLAPTYGMTETGSMITAMHPRDFLQGDHGLGRPLGHASLELNEASGRLCVRSNALFQGYYPEVPAKHEVFETGDQAELGERGELLKVWRADDVIITGGEKVNPRELEAELRRLDGIDAALVVGVPDTEWGERIVALIQMEPGRVLPGEVLLKESLQQCLQSYQIPKVWIEVDALPLSEHGKVDPLRLRAILNSN